MDLVTSLLELWESFKQTGLLGCFAIFLCIVVGRSWMNAKMSKVPEGVDVDSDSDDEREPPRNFTFKQLLHFDGKRCDKLDEDKPVYLSINGKVFDVSKGREFYGPGAPYEMFAGHECGVALVKMSFDESYLDDIAGCKSLNYSEKDELENWSQKFEHYRGYPVVGALIPDSDVIDPNRIITKEELAKNNGEGKIPEGYATNPLYIGAKGKVFDVSFGGVEFYAKGRPYNLFVGVDASRALAKMSLDPAVAQNPDTSDLTEKEIKVLNDWVKTFEERKGYPIVGKLEG